MIVKDSKAFFRINIQRVTEHQLSPLNTHNMCKGSTQPLNRTDTHTNTNILLNENAVMLVLTTEYECRQRKLHTHQGERKKNIGPKIIVVNIYDLPQPENGLLHCFVVLSLHFRVSDSTWIIHASFNSITGLHTAISGTSCNATASRSFRPMRSNLTSCLKGLLSECRIRAAYMSFVENY